MLLRLGSLLAGEGRFEEAVPRLEKAVRMDPGSVDAHFALGRVLVTLERSEPGISHLREAIRLRPDMADLHNALGIALAAEGQLAEARQAFLKAIELDPSHQGALQNLGRQPN